MSNKGGLSAAAVRDQQIHHLKTSIAERKALQAQLYKEAQEAVSDNPYLQTVIDAYDMTFTDKFIVKKKQQIALQALLQGLMNAGLPAHVIDYDRHLILSELQSLRNKRL